MDIVNVLLDGVYVSCFSLAFYILLRCSGDIDFSVVASGLLSTYLTFSICSYISIGYIWIISILLLSIILGVLFNVTIFFSITRKLLLGGYLSSSAFLYGLGLLVFSESIVSILAGTRGWTLTAPDSLKGPVVPYFNLSTETLVLRILGLLIIISIYLWLRYSLAGLQIRALADNPELSELRVPNSNSRRILAYAVSGGIAGFASTGFSLSTYITPDGVLPLALDGLIGMLGVSVVSPGAAILGGVLWHTVNQLSVNIAEIPMAVIRASAFAGIILMIRFTNARRGLYDHIKM